MQLKIKNKFWILENRTDENEIETFLYDDQSSAINTLKELMKSVDSDKLFLSTVDISGKSWNIAAVPWALVAMEIVRG